MLVMSPLHIAEIDHLVMKQRVLDFRELCVRHVGEIRAPDLCAHGRGEGVGGDRLVGARGVVELAGGVDEHGSSSVIGDDCRVISRPRNAARGSRTGARERRAGICRRAGLGLTSRKAGIGPSGGRSNRFEILEGGTANIVSENIEDVQALREWIKGSDIEVAMTELSKAKTELMLAHEKVAKCRAMLVRRMQD